MTETLRLGPFLGGLNVRDAYTAIAPNELADGTNLTLDERGTAIKRNDCPTTASLGAASTIPVGGAPANLFYSQALNVFICQSTTGLHKAAKGAAAWTLFRTCSSAAPVSFCDFAGKLVYVHPADGVRTYDGATDAVADASITGVAITVWQNKLWVARPSSTQVNFSGLGAVTFAALDFQNFKEKDDKPVLALFPSSGLLVFKEDSTYRVNDSTGGGYQTIDWNAGCVGALAVCGSDEGIFHWGLDGLYRSNGIGPAANVGDKLRPRYSAAAVNTTTKPLIAGVSLNGRIYFSYPRTSTTVADAILEYNPRTGWLMETYVGAVALGSFCKYITAAGAVAVSFVSAALTVKDLLTGTDRTGFTCNLLTAFVEPFNGKLARVLRLRPELTVPASAVFTCGPNFTNAGGVLVSQVNSQNLVLANAGTQRPNLWPASVGCAFQVLINDTLAAQASLSVLQVALDFVELER